MKERLRRILESEQISPAKFADIIGVQRSSMSHILSGRNNPGYDFIYNLLLKYPHINADWLLTGRGDMYNTIQKRLEFSHGNDNKDINPDNSTEYRPENSIFEINKESESNNRTLKKILLIYNDNTFEEILPF